MADVLGCVLRSDHAGLVEDHHGVLPDRVDRLGREDVATSTGEKASFVQGHADQATRFRAVDDVAYLGHVLPAVDRDHRKPADLGRGH